MRMLYLNFKEKTEKSLIRLANRKKGILSTSIKNFIDLYSQIMKINFKEGEGIKELSYFIFKKYCKYKKYNREKWSG